MGEEVTQTQTTAAFSEQNFSQRATIYSFPVERQKYFVNEVNHDWRSIIMERLQHLVNLETGWDGYQGEAVSFENANFALKVLEVVCSNGSPAPQIVPGTAGDLQIEWHNRVADVELHVMA